MTVVDSSALAAIIFEEPEGDRFLRVLTTQRCRVSAASLIEAGIVVEARAGELRGHELDELVRRANVDVVPVDARQAELARVAWRRYGRGRHPAGLNLGDLFSYALAKATGEPLLFKGDDFAKTDVLSATSAPAR